MIKSKRKQQNAPFIVAIVSLVVFIGGCNNNRDSKIVKVIPGQGPKHASNLIHIDPRQGIDSTNAYSNIFLDSARIEKFIAQQKMEDITANDFRNFYNNRALQFAWFTSTGFTEQALAFRSLYDYSKDSSTARKSLDNHLDELMTADSITPSLSDPKIVAAELSMSWRFINYLRDKVQDEKKHTAILTGLVPWQKESRAALAASLADNNEIIASIHPGYENLKKVLQQLLTIEKQGGWNNLPLSVKAFNGKNGPLITRLKKRLQLTGQLPGNDTTPAFTPELRNAVKKTQAQFGHPSDSALTLTLIKELNIPVKARITQVLVNMERMRWMPDPSNDKLILVNIPEFKLHVREGKNKKFDMNVVVGKEGHGTVMFSGDLNQIVFSPYWNLPASIVEKEILPSMKKNKKYLEKQHMEINGERNGMPVIRQLPGEWNELGRIKFLFPNSLNIYFHDTPHKWLFSKDQRAYSHGCIRLEEPAKLAAYLLQDDSKWAPQQIDSAMNSGKEHYVKLNQPVPVLIYYFTAWTDETGTLQFRKDVYGHDANFASHLLNNME